MDQTLRSQIKHTQPRSQIQDLFTPAYNIVKRLDATALEALLSQSEHGLTANDKDELLHLLFTSKKDSEVIQMEREINRPYTEVRLTYERLHILRSLLTIRGEAYDINRIINTEKGETALHLAVKCVDYGFSFIGLSEKIEKFVEALIKAGANANMRNGAGQTPRDIWHEVTMTPNSIPPYYYRDGMITRVDHILEVASGLRPAETEFKQKEEFLDWRILEEGISREMLAKIKNFEVYYVFLYSDSARTANLGDLHMLAFILANPQVRELVNAIRISIIDESKFLPDFCKNNIIDKKIAMERVTTTISDALEQSSISFSECGQYFKTRQNVHLQKLHDRANKVIYDLLLEIEGSTQWLTDLK